MELFQKRTDAYDLFGHGDYTLAALFCRRWSRCTCDLFRLYNIEFPISSLDVMYACTNSSATWLLMYLRIKPMFMSERKAARDTAEMWLSMERLESKTIPRFLTVSDGGMMSPPTLIPGMLTFVLWCLDPMIMNSVFPSLSFKKLEVIHWRSSSTHASICCIAWITSDWTGFTDKNIWVSSA